MSGAGKPSFGPLFVAHVVAPDPIGTVHLVSDRCNLVALDFGAVEHRLHRLLRARFGAHMRLEERDDANGFGARVAAYFDGDLPALDAIAIDAGGSPFQRAVWAALRAIPPGETRSYGAIATQIGRPGAARAVGLANSLNPINLVVPCHRVVGSSGAMTGYGGGIERKQWLLDFEASARDRPYRRPVDRTRTQARPPIHASLIVEPYCKNRSLY